MTNKPVIRFIEKHDIDQVIAIEKLSFSIPWTKKMLENELKNPFSRYLILDISGKVIGYAGLWVILDEGHITNIAIHPCFRRQGYGTVLLQELISFARNNGIKALTLEVREGNHNAISFYTRFGFKTEGRRKNYYANNGEDALIMWLNI
jgi:ribosomal-protein-alanine N-acetyltransferase